MVLHRLVHVHQRRHIVPLLKIDLKFQMTLVYIELKKGEGQWDDHTDHDDHDGDDDYEDHDDLLFEEDTLVNKSPREHKSLQLTLLISKSTRQDICKFLERKMPKFLSYQKPLCFSCE